MTAHAMAPLTLDRAFLERVSEASTRLELRLTGLAPAIAPEFRRLTTSLAGGAPELYFTHPCAFPTLLLPAWLHESLGGDPGDALSQDLIYSSIAGYYAVRLVDDVFDQNKEAARRLLPALPILHAEFHHAYARHFPASHPFWPRFFAAWAEGFDAAFEERKQEDLDAAAFVRVSASKVVAATIPLQAVAFQHGLTELPAPWTRLMSALGRWHQFHNDLFDWQRDAVSDQPTYVLGEASRRRRPGESLEIWMMREGFTWGRGVLDAEMKTMRAVAEEIGHPPLARYLCERDAILDALSADVLPGMRALAALGAALAPAGLA